MLRGVARCSGALLHRALRPLANSMFNVVPSSPLICLAAPSLLSVMSPKLDQLATKLQQTAWKPRLSLLAVFGVAGVALSDWSNDIAWCMPDPSPAAQSRDEYGVTDAIRKKYGRYPPWCRLNVDQVPLPFVNDMEQTYETKGATRVVINQLGPALSKRQATGQVCFRPAVPPRQGALGQKRNGCTKSIFNSSQHRALYSVARETSQRWRKMPTPKDWRQRR